MLKIKNRTILNLILLFSIFSLLFAYYVQYVLGHEPCNLCLIERIPYIFTVLIITINIIIKKFEKIIFFILAIIFLLTAFLSFYHFGIEQGFFQESMVCNLTNETDNPSKEEILKLLKDKTISCKDVSFRIFGLSLATINTLLSLFISIINFKSFFNYEKNK